MGYTSIYGFLIRTLMINQGIWGYPIFRQWWEDYDFPTVGIYCNGIWWGYNRGEIVYRSNPSFPYSRIFTRQMRLQTIKIIREYWDRLGIWSDQSTCFIFSRKTWVICEWWDPLWVSSTKIWVSWPGTLQILRSPGTGMNPVILMFDTS